VDITGVVESCTGFKQSFRASDQENIRRIVENSGEAVYHSVSWTRTVRDAFDENTPSLISLAHALRFDSEDVSVSTREEVGPRLEQNTVIETSALPLGSFVKFDEGSGYTQFSGFWTTILSEYHISKPLYDFYAREPFPDVGECTVKIPVEAIENVPMKARFFEKPIPKPQDVPPEFEDDLSRRIELAARRAEQERARVRNPQARERQGES
jgi:hypothetical protein